MKFVGTIEAQGKRHPIEFAIGTPRRSAKAPFECEVTTSYPKSLRTFAFGVDAANAMESAVRLLSGLVGAHPLFTADGVRVEFFPRALVTPSADPSTPLAGLVLSVTHGEDDSLRLTFEDAVRVDGMWKARALYTCHDVVRSKILNLEMSRDELAELGVTVLVRLAANLRLEERKG